ncbi:MAG: DUF4279 domain-containing protein [Ignavibacteria bacterium]|nr:DUF4279 domain-containing protein [Ignavibacteria bacterium]
MKTIIRVDLIITKYTTTHAELTKFLGIAPSNAVNTGDITFNSKLKATVEPINEWTLSSDINSEKPLEDHILRIIEIIKPQREKFLEISMQAEVYLKAVIEFYGDYNPYIDFSSDLFKEMAKMNLELTTSIYFFSE